MDHDLAAGPGGDVGAFRLDHRHALFQTEERPLVAVDRDADHQPVDEHHRPLDDVGMAERDRIERAGIKSDAHVVVPSATRSRARNNIAKGIARPERDRPPLSSP